MSARDILKQRVALTAKGDKISLDWLNMLLEAFDEAASGLVVTTPGSPAAVDLSTINAQIASLLSRANANDITIADLQLEIRKLKGGYHA